MAWRCDADDGCLLKFGERVSGLGPCDTWRRTAAKSNLISGAGLRAAAPCSSPCSSLSSCFVRIQTVVDHRPCQWYNLTFVYPLGAKSVLLVALTSVQTWLSRCRSSSQYQFPRINDTLHGFGPLNNQEAGCSTSYCQLTIHVGLGILSSMGL